MQTLIHSADGELKVDDPFYQIGKKFNHKNGMVCTVTEASIAKTENARARGAINEDQVYLKFAEWNDLAHDRKDRFAEV